MRKSSLKFLVLTLFLSLSFVSQAQEVSLELGPDEIGLNEAFTIKITITNDNLKSYSDFPELEGLVKRSTSLSSKTEYVNGRYSRQQSCADIRTPGSG